jgi:hypothetical protein
MATKVRVNLADEQELLELPGLDPAQAADHQVSLGTRSCQGR